ncbi:hypothetical protein EON65_41785 [archaeon]|nr:MAG: hypothetical protein EON65_41785 [archaeon]
MYGCGYCVPTCVQVLSMCMYVLVCIFYVRVCQTQLSPTYPAPVHPQVSLNLSYDWSRILGANGEAAGRKVTGAGYLGFQNLGNSCYMNSALMALLNIGEVSLHACYGVLWCMVYDVWCVAGVWCRVECMVYDDDVYGVRGMGMVYRKCCT